MSGKLHDAPAWLVVIDVQRVFVESESPWGAPGAEAVVHAVERLVPAFGDNVVFTRFVPPREPAGSWRAYYRKWDFAYWPETEGLWEVAPPLRPRLCLDYHTFSKWDARLRETTAGGSLVLCGISTDCCVLGTAFAAVDGGATVRVVADACRGSTAELHNQALALLSLRAPQLALSTVDEETAGVRAGATQAAAEGE